MTRAAGKGIPIKNAKGPAKITDAIILPVIEKPISQSKALFRIRISVMPMMIIKITATTILEYKEEKNLTENKDPKPEQTRKQIIVTVTPKTGEPIKRVIF